MPGRSQAHCSAMQPGPGRSQAHCSAMQPGPGRSQAPLVATSLLLGYAT